MFESSYDVLNLLTSVDITKALLSHPQNIVALVQITADRLEHIIRNEPEFPNKPEDQGGIAAYAGTLLSRGRSLTGAANDQESKLDLNQQLLNCLRVLSRIIPFIFAQDDPTLEEDLFWRTSKAPKRAQREGQGACEGLSQFIIDDEDENSDEGASRGSFVSPKPDILEDSTVHEDDILPPLIQTLLDICVDLLFIHNFTLPASIDGKDISYTIWENGIGSTASLPVSKEIDQNRCEVLRFLVVLLSKTLYIPSSAYYPSFSLSYDYSPSSTSAIYNKCHAYLVQPPPPLSSSVGAKSRKKVLSLLCTLLNTSLKSGAYHASSSAGLVGVVGGAVGDSYEKLVNGGKRKEDVPRLALVKLCIQTLNILLVTPTSESSTETERERASSVDGNQANLTFSPPQTRPATPDMSSASHLPYSSGNDGPFQSKIPEESNSFKFYLAKLHRKSDLSFIVEVRGLHPFVF